MINKKDQEKAELTIRSLTNFHRFVSNVSESSSEELTTRAINAMAFLKDVDNQLPLDEFKIRTYRELIRRIDVQSHMDETPLLSTIREQAAKMLEEIKPVPAETFYFTKRVSDAVFTCEYIVISKHQIAVMSWTRNNEVGYKMEGELPRGELIEAEINEVPRTVVGAEIDGNIYEVVNPKHVFSYSG